MNSNSLYIASMEANSGKLLITIGIMNLLVHRFEKVAFFRPIIDESKGIDNDIELIRSRYCPEMSYEDCYAFEAEEVKTLATEGKIKDVYEKLLSHVNELYERYDFVLCEGLNNSNFMSLFDSNINLEIAKNLNIPFIGVINGSNQNSREIAEEIKIAESIIQKSGCTHFATFINRISDQTIKEIKSQSSNENNLSNSNQFNTPYPVFLLAEKNELASATLADIKKALNANCVLGSVDDMYRVVRQIKIATMTVEHFLHYIEEGDLIIVGGDRADILLAALSILSSHDYPNIAGILLTGGFIPEKKYAQVIKRGKASYAYSFCHS